MSRYLAELDYCSDDDDEYNEEENEWSIEEQRLKLYGREESDEEEDEVDGVDDLVDHFKSHSMVSTGEQKRIVPKNKKKKEQDDANRIIIVQVEEKKSKENVNWDSVYSKLENRKLNQMKFTMKDIESHKLHYDKVDTSRFEVTNSVAVDNSDDEDAQQRRKFKVFEQKVIKQSVDLSLGKMAGSAHGSLVFLSGGGKSGRIYSQLVCYEVKEKKWVDMKENMFNYYRKQNLTDMLFPPAIEGHIILILGEYLIWYDFKHTCMALKNYLELIKPTPANKIDKSNPPIPVWMNVSVETITKAVRETTGHSLSKSNNEPKFWSFGGRDVNGVLTNQFVEYNMVRRTFWSKVQNGVIEFSMTRDLANIANPKAIPLPRENHAQCTVGNSIFIFGGNYTQKDNLLNDLHRYDIVSKKWNEIDLTFIPPPMRNHSLCNCIDQYIYLTGGILRGNTISDVIYRFDVKNNEFAVINPGGPSEYVLYGNGITTPRDLQLPRADHTTLYDQGQLYMIGGMTDYAKRSYCKEVVVLKECSDIGVENSSYIYLKNEFEKQANGDLSGYDLILKVAERTSGETEYIYVHKCLVSSRSTYFKDLLVGLNDVDMVDGKSIFELNDYHLDTMNIFIRFLYTGDIIIPDTVNTECLQELLNISKLDIDRYGIILSVCDQKRLYLDSSTAVLNQLKHDCSALYQNIEDTMDNFIREPCAENNYADVTIQLLDPHTGELLNELRAHKLFICRSNYISTVFSSGMEETTTGVIKFDEISLNGLLSVLKYLYTNEIIVSIEHAVEVFICSLLFQLNELANYCRTIVIQHITVDNVLELSFLVDVYNDLALKNNCIKCISQNFEEISKRDGFENLSSEIKGEARTRHFEMVKKLTKMKAKERMKVKK